MCGMRVGVTQLKAWLVSMRWRMGRPKKVWAGLGLCVGLKKEKEKEKKRSCEGQLRLKEGWKEACYVIISIYIFFKTNSID